MYVCICFNANLLHYYVLRVPHHADRWHYYGLFCIYAPLGQTTLFEGMCICISEIERSEVRATACVIVL